MWQALLRQCGWGPNLYLTPSSRLPPGEAPLARYPLQPASGCFSIALDALFLLSEGSHGPCPRSQRRWPSQILPASWKFIIRGWSSRTSSDSVSGLWLPCSKWGWIAQRNHPCSRPCRSELRSIGMEIGGRGSRRWRAFSALDITAYDWCECAFFLIHEMALNLSLNLLIILMSCRNTFRTRRISRTSYKVPSTCTWRI